MPLPADVQSAMCAREGALKDEHHAYLESHPEVQSILSDFISAALAEQPADVFEFARTHFARPPPAAPGNAQKSSWPDLHLLRIRVDARDPLGTHLGAPELGYQYEDLQTLVYIGSILLRTFFLLPTSK